MACCTLTGAFGFTDVVFAGVTADAVALLAASGEKEVALQVTGFFG